MPEPKVSIIIPAYNAEQTISGTIKAVLEQDVQGQLDIIVVDDGSTDQTAQLVQSFKRVLYVNQPNAGSASARNRGVAAALGDIFLFTDSDCIPHKDWVRQILSGFHHEKTGAVAGSYGIANPESLLASCIHDEIMFRHRRLMPNETKVLGSYNFGIRRHVFDMIGGFDEGYRTASGEDNDLSYKLILAGYKIAFVRDALVDHYHTTSLKRYLYEQFRHGFWRAKMYRDHPRMSGGDNYTFWKDIVEIPWAGLASLSLIFAIFSGRSFLILFLISIFLLTLGEFVFAVRISRRVSRIACLTVTMFLRSFARTFGFLSGVGKILFSAESWGLTEKSKS